MKKYIVHILLLAILFVTCSGFRIYVGNAVKDGEVTYVIFWDDPLEPTLIPMLCGSLTTNDIIFTSSADYIPGTYYAYFYGPSIVETLAAVQIVFTTGDVIFYLQETQQTAFEPYKVIILKRRGI